jgi:hypothetical protein
MRSGGQAGAIGAEVTACGAEMCLPGVAGGAAGAGGADGRGEGVDVGDLVAADEVAAAGVDLAGDDGAAFGLDGGLVGHGWSLADSGLVYSGRSSSRILALDFFSALACSALIKTSFGGTSKFVRKASNRSSAVVDSILVR